MDPKRPNSPNDNNKNPKGKKPKSKFGLFLIAVLVVVLVTMVWNYISDSRYTETNYDDFLKEMQTGNLAEVEIQSDRIIYMTKTEKEKPASEQQACFTGLPVGGDAMRLAEELAKIEGCTVKQEIVEDNSVIMMILYYALMIGGLFLLMNLLTRKMGDGGIGGMGKNNAKVYMEKQTGVTFKDVAGQDEAKEA